MKIYSDILVDDDLASAADGKPGLYSVGVAELDHLGTTRVRSNGWNVKLSGSSPRATNTGTHGGQHEWYSPATWDEWGLWIAALYELDPDARVGPYKDRDHFHAATERKYTPVVAV